MYNLPQHTTDKHLLYIRHGQTLQVHRKITDNCSPKDNEMIENNSVILQAYHVSQCISMCKVVNEGELPQGETRRTT